MPKPSPRIYEAFDEPVKAYAQFEKARAIDMSQTGSYEYYWATAAYARNNRLKDAMATPRDGLTKYPHSKAIPV